MSALLREIPVRQAKNEPQRRWFTSDDMDLIVWIDENGMPCGFQLCYDKGSAERALTMLPRGSLTHRSVDDGERNPGINRTGVLGGEVSLDAPALQKTFFAASKDLPPAYASLVIDAIARHGRPDFR